MKARRNHDCSLQSCSGILSLKIDWYLPYRQQLVSHKTGKNKPFLSHFPLNNNKQTTTAKDNSSNKWPSTNRAKGPMQHKLQVFSHLNLLGNPSSSFSISFWSQLRDFCLIFNSFFFISNVLLTLILVLSNYVPQ